MIPINPEAIGDPNQTPVVYLGEEAGKAFGIPQRVQPDPSSPLDLDALKALCDAADLDKYALAYVGDYIADVDSPATNALAEPIERLLAAVPALLAALDEARRELAETEDGLSVQIRNNTRMEARAQKAESALAAARADAERIRELIDSYPPGSQFAQSGAQALFRRVLNGGTE
jgi:hypothetical protein